MTKVELLYSLLQDCQYHCTICINKIIESGQLAKVAQNLRNSGYTMEKTGNQFCKSLYCDTCGMHTKHYKLTSPNKSEETNRFSFPSFLRERLKDIYGEKDNFTGSYSVNLEIDHRVTPYREEDQEIKSSITNEEIKKRFQFLSKENNNIKREICKKCISTGERGISLIGIPYFYSGTYKYEGTCEGCFWAYPEKWREHLKFELYRK